jgi:HlyD family secretion protein
VSEIFEALTIAQDRAVEKLVERQVESEEPIKEPIEVLPKRVVFSHRKLRNGLILAFFAVGLALLATNYAFNAGGVLVKSQPIYGVAFEGTVQPASEFSITADLGGTVAGITVKVGDTVQKGQPLLRMDGREAELALQQADVELQAAQSNLEQFRAQLAEANARVVVSQREEQQIPTRQWRDSPERAAATYDLALNNYNRTKALYDVGVAPKQELDTRATELRIARDDLENAKKLAGASSKLEREQTIQANLQALVTREDLQEQLRQAQLKYQQAKGQAEEKVVRATQAGVVSELLVHLGDHISPGTAVARLAELNHMIAKVPVAARMIAELKVGQSAQVALPSSPPRQVQGKIRVINPLPSPNMTHIVEVEFDNPTLLLLAGQAAEVRFAKP